MKILVTGGAGFIGSEFLNTYVARFPQYTFINIDSLTYASDLGRISEDIATSNNYYFIKGDVRDREFLEREVFEKYHPTDIIHFAGESHVDNSILSPSLFLETNILATGHLLDCYRKYALSRFHFVSTDEVYGDRSGRESATENTPFQPSSPYAASKAGADLLVQSYGRTYGLNYTISRGSNTYGRGQHREKFLPTILSSIKENKQIPLYGDGTAVRDWIDVRDHVRAIWEIFTRGKDGGIYNVGGNEKIANKDLVYKILDLFGKGKSGITFVKDRPGHDMLYSMDTTKIENELSFFREFQLSSYLREICK